MKQLKVCAASRKLLFLLPLGQNFLIHLKQNLYINERGDLNETKYLFSLYVSFIDSIGIGGK
jgi:hypothetical protein